MEDLKLLEEIRNDFVSKFDNDPNIKRICNVMINEFKARKKALNLPDSSLSLNDKHKTGFKELRPELIEFLEANNYFISVLKTKENAIGIVDNYLKVYKP